MRLSLTVLASLALELVSAAPVQNTIPTPSTRLLVGGQNAIKVIDFDGTQLSVITNYSMVGTLPSWLVLKENTILYAVDELSNKTRVFDFDPNTGDIALVQEAVGSFGNAHCELNQDATILACASFGAGAIDVYDATGDKGQLSLITTFHINDTLGPNKVRQDASHVHECVHDPRNEYFFCNDLGTDTVNIVNIKDRENIQITNKVRVDPPGNGPRHAAVYPAGAAVATHYMLVSEMASLFTVYRIEYEVDTVQLIPIQQISTFGAAFPPGNATTAVAGEIVISPDNRHVYVTNRLIGNETDSISHFTINSDATVNFVESNTSGGMVPRSMSIGGPDGNSFAFVSNQNGNLTVFPVDVLTGELGDDLIAQLDVQGPEFAQDMRTFPLP